MTKGYQLHSDSTEEYGAFCLREDTWCFVAVAKNLAGNVQASVNGHNTSTDGHKISDNPDTTLGPCSVGGSTDEGHFFNLRIWDNARHS